MRPRVSTTSLRLQISRFAITIVDQEIARLCDEVRDFAEHFLGNYGELGIIAKCSTCDTANRSRLEKFNKRTIAAMADYGDDCD